MKPKQPLRAVNATGDVTMDVQLIKVADAAITAGSGEVDLSGGSGDVTGAASSTDNAVARFNGTGGKTIQNSAVIIADTTGNISGTQKVTFSGSTSGTAALQANAIAGTTTATLPTTTATLGYLEIPQNAQAGAYGLVLTDSGKHIYHALGDGAQAITIPANASVAFPIGSAITIVNDSATSITVVITTDVLMYANVGAITTLTIPQYNQATILKVLATQWNASGTAGCTTA